MKRILRILRDKVRYILVTRKWSEKLRNDNFTIFASDCTGGVLYHELNKRFLSPTINMYFDAQDFMRFIENPEKYFYIPMELDKKSSLDEGYPVAKLGDIKLHLVHYKTIEEAQQKWLQRIERINWTNVYYVMNDRNGCTNKDIEQFDEFLNKNGRKGVIFMHLPKGKIKNGFYIHGSEAQECVDTMTAYTSILHRRMDQFKWLEWIDDIQSIGEK